MTEIHFESKLFRIKVSCSVLSPFEDIIFLCLCWSHALLFFFYLLSTFSQFPSKADFFLFFSFTFCPLPSLLFQESHPSPWLPSFITTIPTTIICWQLLYQSLLSFGLYRASWLPASHLHWVIHEILTNPKPSSSTSPQISPYSVFAT